MCVRPRDQITLWPTHPGQHNKAADAVEYFDLLFLYVKCWSSFQIVLKFVSNCPISNILVVFQILTKPLSEAMRPYFTITVPLRH